MNKKWLFTLAAASLITASGFCNQDVGVVNFSSVVEESKLGKEKHKEMRKFSEDLQERFKQTQSEYTDIEKKEADADYLDTLSPEAEKDLKARKQQLAQELGAMQMQYQEMLQQTQQKLLQTMLESTANAAKQVAKEKNLKLVVNKELCFYYDDGLDVTDQVVDLLNKEYPSSEEVKKGT